MTDGTDQQQNDDDKKLFAGGLAQEATEKDLREYFSKFGDITSVTLKMDPMTGRSRGFAFIVYKDVDSLGKVLSQDHVVKGKKVAVKKAASKQGKIYVGKFKEDITEDDIKEHFQQFGNIVEIQRPVDRSKNEPKNFCFVTFDKEETANTLLKKASVNIKGQDVEIKKVNNKPDGRGGRGGGHAGWGMDPNWGYGGGWGYDMPPGPWAYGGWGAAGWGSPYGGGGKMGGGSGNFRGRGRGGRSAPY